MSKYCLGAKGDLNEVGRKLEMWLLLFSNWAKRYLNEVGRKQVNY